jgi:DNA modification methylase
MRNFPDESIHLVIADPPYNLGQPYPFDNLTDEEYVAFLYPKRLEVRLHYKARSNLKELLLCLDNLKWFSLMNLGDIANKTSFVP